MVYQPINKPRRSAMLRLRNQAAAGGRKHTRAAVHRLFEFRSSASTRLEVFWCNGSWGGMRGEKPRVHTEDLRVFRRFSPRPLCEPEASQLGAQASVLSPGISSRIRSTVLRARGNVPLLSEIRPSSPRSPLNLRSEIRPTSAQSSVIPNLKSARSREGRRRLRLDFTKQQAETIGQPKQSI